MQQTDTHGIQDKTCLFGKGIHREIMQEIKISPGCMHESESIRENVTHKILETLRFEEITKNIKARDDFFKKR